MSKWEWKQEQGWEQVEWLPAGAKYTGRRYVVWDWYLSDKKKLVTVFRAYTTAKAAANYYQKVSREAAFFGGLVKRLGVRHMSYNELIPVTKVYDPNDGKPTKIPKNDGCSAVSWAASSLLVFEKLSAK
jgi:hypothetical protein